MNSFKTMTLLAALTALFLFVGNLLGGQGGIMIALIFAVVMNVGAFWYSDKLILRMYRAAEVTEGDAPRLVQTVRELAQAAGLPMPKVYIVPMGVPNAFATGRNPENAAVAVTDGILELLDERELRGVLAHELAHIKNRDTLIQTVAATIGGALSMLANMAMFGMMFGGRGGGRGHPIGALLGIIIAPLAASLIQMAISRSREFLADATGARTSNDPLALARALEKIERHSRAKPIRGGVPATASLFIINPFSREGMNSLFSTHPRTAERVRRLEALAGGPR